MEQDGGSLCQTGQTSEIFSYDARPPVRAFYYSQLYRDLTMLSTFLKYLIFVAAMKCLIYV